jgi:hypothetical protein
LIGFPGTAGFANADALPAGTNRPGGMTFAGADFAGGAAFAGGADFAPFTGFAGFIGGFATNFFAGAAAFTAAGFRFAAFFGAGFERALAGFDFGRALCLREVAIG